MNVTTENIDRLIAMGKLQKSYATVEQSGLTSRGLGLCVFASTVTTSITALPITQ